MTMVDVSDLIGVPFVSRGRDPQKGLDCWGLVLEVSRRFGQTLPDFYVDALDGKQIGVIYNFVRSEWKELEKPEPGAVVGIRLDRACLPGTTQHFGICVDRRQFIHTLKNVGVIISKFDRFKNIITGYYQWCA